jgi:threonine 3-dehydrogenase
MATLITGGSGVIGAEVTRLLLERGEDRPALFDLNPSSHRLGDMAARVDVIRGDLGTFSNVLDAVKRAKPTAIYHLGGMFSLPCEGDPPSAVRVNALGTFHVLEAARLFDVPQVLFSSSLATYGFGLGDGPIDDATLQRPAFLYGATKLFGEHLGLFYRRKYGLDFRGLRYPAVVAPGVTTPGAAQYLSLVIEASAKGKSFTITVGPETRFPVLYVKDAARAIVELAAAPSDRIQTVTYLLAGISPVPSAGELVALLRTRVPGAQVEFRPDPALQRLMDPTARPLVDDNARKEWGWRPVYGLEEMVADCLQELRLQPNRYSSLSGAP